MWISRLWNSFKIQKKAYRKQSFKNSFDKSYPRAVTQNQRFWPLGLNCLFRFYALFLPSQTAKTRKNIERNALLQANEILISSFACEQPRWKKCFEWFCLSKCLNLTLNFKFKAFHKAKTKFQNLLNKSYPRAKLDLLTQIFSLGLNCFVRFCTLFSLEFYPKFLFVKRIFAKCFLL